MTDDSGSSELYCVKVNPDLYHGSVWGADAAHKGLKMHFSGRDVVRERIEAVPVEVLESLADAWTADAELLSGDRRDQKEQCAQELRQVIGEYE